MTLSKEAINKYFDMGHTLKLNVIAWPSGKPSPAKKEIALAIIRYIIRKFDLETQVSINS